MKHIARIALANPLFNSALAALLGILCVYADAAKWFVPVVSSVVESVGAALITAATFGILFEYFGKLGLINDAIALAVGQSRASSLGVTDFVDDVTRINHRDLIRSSGEFIGCSRYSSLFLESHRKEVYDRLTIDKLPVKFVRMKDSSSVPHGQGPNLRPDEFFKNLENYDPQILNLVELYEVDRLLSYNFVKFDSGIWIKLYLNSGSVETPPAFFVSRGSPLFQLYNGDVDRLFTNATRVNL
jgi:hypothetical protein